MSPLRLRLPRSVEAALRAYHLAPGKDFERLSFLSGRLVRSGDECIVVVPPADPVLFADDCFRHRQAGRVTLHRDVTHAVLAQFAASDFDVLVNVHDHWFCESGTQFSDIDDADDIRLARYLDGLTRKLHDDARLGPRRTLHSLSLVLDRSGFAARTTVVSAGSHRFVPVDVALVVGDRLARVIPNNAVAPASAETQDDPRFARHRDFVSGQVQALIGSLRVGLVGCGGLGSLLAPGLAHLGFRDFVLVDGDTLEASNLNRWLGAAPAQIGQPKVHVLSELLERQFPAARLIAVQASLHTDDAVDALRGCDVLVGATDNDLARFALNRLALQYGVPYFDAGTAVTGAPSATNFRWRTTLVVPGVTACLECTAYPLLDPDSIERELASPELRAARRSAGYVVDRPDVGAPSVLPLNMVASGQLLTEVLNYAAGLRECAFIVSGGWRSASVERADRVNFPEPPAPDCPVCAWLAGRCDASPLPRPGASGLAVHALGPTQQRPAP